MMDFHAVMPRRQTTLPPLSKGLWRRVARIARPYAGKVAWFVAATAASSFVLLVPPLLFRELIDSAIPAGDRSMIDRLALVAIGVAILNAVLQIGARRLSSRIGEGLIYDLRAALYDRVQRMPIGFFTTSQTGALMSRLNNDVVGAQSALTGTLGSVVSNVISLVLTLGVMVVLDWRLTLLSLGVLPLFVIPARRVGRRIQAMALESMELNAQMNATMTERFGVAGALLVKLFGRHDAEHAEFSASAARVRDIGIRQAVYTRVFLTALTLVGAVGTVVVYWVGGRLVVSGAFTVGTIVAFAAYLVQVYQPLTMLTNARVDIMTSFVSFDRVFEVLDMPNPIVDREDALRPGPARGAVRFEDVWFSYPGNSSIASLTGEQGVPEESAPVLRGVSFEIEPGRMVALVGPSGAGKTTIAMLVPRLHEVTSGRLCFDGHDVRDLAQDWLRSSIGVVTQDPHLFHDTIEANLRYAKPEASDEELRAACRSARIHDLIESLQDGYRTVVGERGYRMSGGEKQRLAIARVLLKNPALVILDEATAHLDSESEQLIQEALARALSGRSSLVIAHRLSTIVAADQILVVSGGRIVERGRHEELVDALGVYSDLYRTQFAKAGV